MRHAETDENIVGHALSEVEGLAARTSEVWLNEEGILQAEKLGHHLKNHKISHAYSSPLKRAIHTAEKILQHHPEAEFVVVDHLDEQNLGAAETMPKHIWKEIKKKSTDPWHLFKSEKGESYSELQERVVNFFNGLLEKHESEDTILIVSHGGTLGVLMLHILEKPLAEEHYRANQPKNTEFTIIEVSPEGYKKIHALNSREHLD